MRPKKTRWIKCTPKERCFRPLCKSANKLEGVVLSLDEFEAVRLYDFEGFQQKEAARKMRISRPTFSRIISSAHNKIGVALVDIRAIRIEGGCCKVIRRIEHNKKR